MILKVFLVLKTKNIQNYNLARISKTLAVLRNPEHIICSVYIFFSHMKYNGKKETIKSSKWKKDENIMKIFVL